MTLLFSKPRKHAGGKVDSFWIGAAIKGYLQYRNIFIGTEMRDFTVTFNHCYDFYDIHMYAIAGNYGNPTKHINETISVLREDGVKVRVLDTFRWDNGTRREGKRLWVEAI